MNEITSFAFVSKVITILALALLFRFILKKLDVFFYKKSLRLLSSVCLIASAFLYAFTFYFLYSYWGARHDQLYYIVIIGAILIWSGRYYGQLGDKFLEPGISLFTWKEAGAFFRKLKRIFFDKN